MFNELLTIAICALSANAAANTSNDIAIMNSTDYNISLVDVQNHNEYDFSPRMEAQIPNSQQWSLYATSNEAPSDIWYYETYVDNETEVHITAQDWVYEGYDNYRYDFTRNANTTAIQFFNKVSMAGETYYIMQPNLENQGFGIGNLLPENSSAILELQGNSSISITKLTYDKKRMDKGILGYAYFKINDLTIIANNSVTGVTPNNPSECAQIMMYQGTYTNKLTFTSGYYPRNWSTQGYTTDIQMLSKDYQPYASFTTAGNTGISLVPITTGVTLVALSFEALNSLLGYVVFPGLTLGMLLLIPIFLALMFTIIKLVKKG